MPNSLSPEDQKHYAKLLLNFDSLLYAANYAFMHGQAGPRHQRRSMNRRELVDLLRRRIPSVAQVSTSRSANDRDLYTEMLDLIRSLRTSVTGKFMHHDPATRSTFMHEVVLELDPTFEALGCGDLCYEKERGCVECPPQD